MSVGSLVLVVLGVVLPCTIAAVTGHAWGRVGLTVVHGTIAAAVLVAMLLGAAGAFIPNATAWLAFTGLLVYLAATTLPMWTASANRFFAAHRQRRASLRSPS